MADATLELDLSGNFSIEAAKAARAAKDLENATRRTAQASDAAAKSARHQAAAITQLNDFTQQAAYSGGDFSRILLAASSQFDQLRSQTGSASSAFKLLGSAMLNPIAIGLAAITVFTLFGDKLKELAGGGRSLESALESLGETTAAYSRSNEDAGQSIATLTEKYGALAGEIQKAESSLASLLKLQAQKDLKDAAAGIGAIIDELITKGENLSNALSVAGEGSELEAMNTTLQKISKRFELTAQDAETLRDALLKIKSNDVIGGVQLLGTIAKAGNVEFQELLKNILAVYDAEKKLNQNSSGNIQAQKTAANLAKQIKINSIDETLQYQLDAARDNADKEKEIRLKANADVEKKYAEIFARTDISNAQKESLFASEAGLIRAKELSDVKEYDRNLERQILDALVAQQVATARLNDQALARKRANDGVFDSILKQTREYENLLAKTKSQSPFATAGESFAAAEISKLAKAAEDARNKVLSSIGEFGEGGDMVSQELERQNDQYKKQIALVGELAQAIDAQKTAMARTNSVISSVNAAIDNFVDNGKFKFNDFARSVILDLIKIELKIQASQLLKSALGGLGGYFGGGTPNIIASPSIPAIGARGGLVTTSGIQPMKLAMGGPVGVQGQDSIPALLMPGEYVLNKGQVDSLKNNKNQRATNTTTINNFYGFTSDDVRKQIRQEVASNPKMIYGVAKQGEREAGVNSFR